MTRQEFAQELLLRTMVMQGQKLNKNELTEAEKNDMARQAKTALALAEAAPSGLFTT